MAAIRTEVAAKGLFTAEAVAKRARTSPATFYNHFSSKELALASAFAAAMDDLSELVNQGLQVERLLQLGLEGFCADWSKVCAGFFRANAMLLAVAQAEAPRAPELRGIFAKRQHESLARYTQFVELGQRAQMVRQGDADAMAKLLLMTNQCWNHPFLRELEPSDALYQEMTQLMLKLLAPTQQP